MASVARTLKAFFDRNGYVKIKRARKKSHPSYEVRITVQPGAELDRLNACLAAAGLVAGRPFAKRKQLRVPIYGRRRVAKLLALVGVRDRRVEV